MPNTIHPNVGQYVQQNLIQLFHKCSAKLYSSFSQLFIQVWRNCIKIFDDFFHPILEGRGYIKLVPS
jgi:hypothetical protein